MIRQMDSDLRRLLEKAYLIFPEQKFAERLQVCGCDACVSPWDELPLRTLARRELSPSLLEAYLNSADPYDERKKGAEFRHFLPRIFELAMQNAFKARHCVFVRLSNAGEGLGGADFRNHWAADEIEIIDALFDTLFVKRLTLAPEAAYCRDLQRPRFPKQESLDLALFWKAQSYGDIGEYLSIWEKNLSRSATLHIAALINAGSARPWSTYQRLLVDGRLPSPFWDDLPDQEAQIVSWLLAKLQTDRLERLLPYETDDMAYLAVRDAIEAVEQIRNPTQSDRWRGAERRKAG